MVLGSRNAKGSRGQRSPGFSLQRHSNPTVLFPLCGTTNALRRIRDGLETGLGDLHAAHLALAIAAIVDPLDGRRNLVERVLPTPEQTQREFLIGVPSSKLCHVIGHACRVAAVLVQRVIFHLGHVALESCPQGEESFAMRLDFRFRHSVGPQVRIDFRVVWHRHRVFLPRGGFVDLFYYSLARWEEASWRTVLYTDTWFSVWHGSLLGRVAGIMKVHASSQAVRSDIAGANLLVKITLRVGESVQEAVRRLRKIVERSGLKRELRRRERYEKPSDVRRKAKIRAIRRAKARRAAKG